MGMTLVEVHNMETLRHLMVSYVGFGALVCSSLVNKTVVQIVKA
jgi:hypothetical protein